MMRRVAKWGTTSLILSAFLSASAWALSLEVAEAPSTTLSLTVSAIRSAQRTLLLNIYELSSSDVADALLDRIRAGVHVEIIEEGQPVGGMSAVARGVENQLAQAMRNSGQDDHLYEMTSHVDEDTVVKRRFRYNHAKYAVIDGRHLLIGSENYSPTGNPRQGVKGNRGWEVLVHDASLAAQFTRIFREDSDLSKSDVIDLVADYRSRPKFTSLLATEMPRAAEVPITEPFAPWNEPTTLEASSVEPITSPETSLSGLVKLLNSARKTLDIEQMSFDSGWGKYAEVSPLFEAVVKAARRGVRVRILLNDEMVFAHPGHARPSKNLETVRAFNRVAREEGLNLKARTADLKKMGVTYIHNKGVLVDGTKTLISSINWGNNSVLNNREAAIVIHSNEVFDHYVTLFNNDWTSSATPPWANEQSKSKLFDLNSLLEPAAPDVNTYCPDHLRVGVKFGTLRSSDPEDESFSSLSGAQFSILFVRSYVNGACVLTDQRSMQLAGKRRFLEIRRKANGDMTAVLEGYTPDGALYSVRTALDAVDPSDDADDLIEGAYGANVYNGSGPSREKLGTAVMSFGQVDVAATAAQ